MKSYSFTYYGSKLTITRNLPYCGECCNCGKHGYNRLKNHTKGFEAYLCDECLAEAFED